jgi:S1-C subfamily serine protease
MAGFFTRNSLSGALGLAVLLTCLALPEGRAQAPPDRTEIVRKVRPALVEIIGPLPGGSGAMGSGFLLTSDGQIATSLHVIRELTSGSVRLWNGDVYDGVSVLAFDDRRDLAIIKIRAFDLPTLPLGNSNELQAGESLLLFGNPPVRAGILSGTVTAGIVSAFHEYDGFRIIQTDAATNPGNSGGPLINLRGQAVGILGFKMKPVENLSFAVPINYLRALVDGPMRSMTLSELRTALVSEGMKSTNAPRDGSMPRLWKSASTAARYTVQVDNDYIYAEQVLPDVQRPWLMFSKIEGRKSGKLFVGKMHYAAACRNKSCPFDDEIEFTLVTPTRIEGAMLLHPADANLSCEPCQFSKTRQIIRFVWIPE